jgi:hypothetical protein
MPKATLMVRFRRDKGNGDHTIFNKRQRLQSMLRWAGVDPKIFPPKPKYEKALQTIYTRSQLRGLFEVAKPYQKMVCNLALKLGLRDREVQFAEFSDISCEESVFRVKGKVVVGRNGPAIRCRRLRSKECLRHCAVMVYSTFLGSFSRKTIAKLRFGFARVRTQAPWMEISLDRSRARMLSVARTKSGRLPSM